VCVGKDGTLNIAFELTDGVDFVNHLSLLCNCLNIQSLSKTTIAESSNAVVTFIFILVLVLQGNAATKLRCGGKYCWYLIRKWFLVTMPKNIKIGQHLTKLQ